MSTLPLPQDEHPPPELHVVQPPLPLTLPQFGSPHPPCCSTSTGIARFSSHTSTSNCVANPFTKGPNSQFSASKYCKITHRPSSDNSQSRISKGNRMCVALARLDSKISFSRS